MKRTSHGSSGTTQTLQKPSTKSRPMPSRPLPNKPMIRYGSGCSGIEAASVAWFGIPGWHPSFFSEIEAFPRAVLKHHYPRVPLHGDFTTIQAGEYEPIDLLVGGTPCQDFSIAGLRAGMDGARGNLTLEFLRLAHRLGPRWIVWENVPGVLSSNGGRDFGTFLGGLAELGYGWAYRCLDAQYFGLAQRRKRVFVVGYLGDWRRAAAVLFEPEGLRGDPAPRRQSRQEIAPTISARTRSGGGLGTDFDLDGGLIFAIQERAVSENPEAEPDGIGVRADGLAYTLEARSNVQAVAFGGNNSSGPIDIATALNASHTASGRQDFETETFIAHALTANGFDASEDGTGRGTPIVPVNGVRRLTPRECERLQGFPDDYTRIPVRHYAKRRITRLRPADMWEPAESGGWWLMAADGPRYKSLGNSMAVPVMRKIGERIAMMEEIHA